MSYLIKEWKNYSDQPTAVRLLLVLLAVTEDTLRWVGFRYRPLRPVWFLRTRLTEGKTRRLLRRIVKHWAKNGMYEQQYFNFTDRALTVTFEWRPVEIMTGSKIPTEDGL